MKGQHNLNAIRRQGLKPACVFVEVLDTAPAYNLGNDPEFLRDKLFPELHILPADEVEKLNLSCLAGLEVHIVGTNERRMGQVSRRIAELGFPGRRKVLPKGFAIVHSEHYRTLSLLGKASALTSAGEQ